MWYLPPWNNIAPDHLIGFHVALKIPSGAHEYMRIHSQRHRVLTNTAAEVPSIRAKQQRLLAIASFQSDRPRSATEHHAAKSHITAGSERFCGAVRRSKMRPHSRKQALSMRIDHVHG